MLEQMFIFGVPLYQLVEYSGVIHMPSQKKRVRGITVGLSLALLGVTLILCSMPIFSNTRQEAEQVPRSETVMNYPFEIHQFQDETVQLQLSIGQELSILASANNDFNFSIANFTNTDHVIHPDNPDTVYLFLNSTSSINTTWTPQTRSPEPGSYYLVFLARNASSASPVQIYANVTKTWTEIKLKTVPAEEFRSLIDPNFLYIGSATAILGATVLFIFLYPRNRPRKRK
jgi:hypothetical protein